MDDNDVTPDHRAQLAELATLCGIAPSYWSFFGEHVDVPTETLCTLLRAMGIPVKQPSDAPAALTAERDSRWSALIPATVVVRAGGGVVPIAVTEGNTAELQLVLEDGSTRDIELGALEYEVRWIDGSQIARREVPLPTDLPLGWHELHALERDAITGRIVRSVCATLVVAPQRLSEPPARPHHNGRSWGVMAQLYSTRSHDSWGMGDFADLGQLAAITGREGADFLLINPIHAGGVVAPIEPSPYLPATRRFISPLFVRPERIAEYDSLAPEQRAVADEAHARASDLNSDASTLDRDAAWAAKLIALELVAAVPRSTERQAEFDAFVAEGGKQLADFALWSALQGDPRAAMPGGVTGELREYDSAEIAALREQLTDRVAFYSWLQWVADDQLAAAQVAARKAGMQIGIMHDLAVGVHPLGSESWAASDVYARNINVGAPPDMFNQQGQDWSQPPFLPRALERTGYAPWRDMIRHLLRHAGALRIDHIIGLFRLWWIPAGQDGSVGTYVYYDHEAMLGVLLLEAERAGAVIIGEDLGNVEPWVRDYLVERGVLGTSVLWFEQRDGWPLPREAYRVAALATVNTHDLPPTAGYLAEEHVDLRERLGLLTQPVDEVRAEAREERERMLQVLGERGLIGWEPTEEETIIGLHRYLAGGPSLLFGVSLVDAVGERRAQNQPGTFREYPNWCVPLADGDGNVVLLDDLAGNARFRALCAAVDAELGAGNCVPA